MVAFIAALRVFPKESLEHRPEPFDYVGSLLFMFGITLFLFTVSNAEAWGWAASATWAGFTVSIVLLLGFFWRERVYAYPMLDLALYRIRTFRIGTFAAMLSFVAMFFTTVMLPFYMQDALHFTPQMTGYVMAASPLTMVLVAPLSGWISDRMGPDLLTTAGLLLNALGFALLNLLSTSASPWLIAAFLAIFGIGQGMFQSPNNASVMGSVPRAKLGTAGGINALVRNVGMILGISLSVSLFSFRMRLLTGSFTQIGVAAVDSIDFVIALHTVFWAAAGIALLAALISAGRRQPATAP